MYHKSIISGLVLALSLIGVQAVAASDTAYQTTTIAENLAYPWCLAFLPDGNMLVTERDGNLRIIRNNVLDPNPISGVPETYVEDQGGLFDVVLHPNFLENHMIYLTYAHGTPEDNHTRVARARLDGNSLQELEVIFESKVEKSTAVHYGGRMTFLDDGTFLLTIGDGFNYREQAQVLSNHFGTIVRLNDDGSVPEDNPFVGQPDALPEIWSYGHRNEQGLVFDPVSGRVYENEHGPQGGDELNLIEKGKNYGWPIITYGIDYSGAKITPYTEYEGMEQPLIDWTPSLAVSGLDVYNGDLFPTWKGDLFASTLVERSVRRIDLEDGEVVGQEVLFAELEERIRDVRTGPDGALYLLIDSPEGYILRVEPKD